MRVSIILLLLHIPGSILARNVPARPRYPYHRNSISKQISLRCYPFYEESIVGITYATQHQLAGVKVHEFISWKFGVPFMLITEVDWRIPHKGDSYFNLEFTKCRIARIARSDLGAEIGYKRVLAAKSYMVEQFCGGPAYLAWTYTISLQYSYQHESVNSEDTSRQHGMRLQISKEIGSLFDVTAYSTYLFKSWQYSVGVKYNPFGSAIYIGAGFEKIDAWEEFNISVLYRYW
jgi:hypothetical protein